VINNFLVLISALSNFSFCFQEEIKISGVTVFVNPYTEPDEEEEKAKEEEEKNKNVEEDNVISCIQHILC
jgi:hypothetical protein